MRRLHTFTYIFLQEKFLCFNYLTDLGISKRAKKYRSYRLLVNSFPDELLKPQNKVIFIKVSLDQNRQEDVVI